MKHKGLVSGLTFLIIVSWSSQSLSLQEQTHQAINEHIARNTISGFSLNDYLKNNLGFKEGVEEILSGFDAKGTSVTRGVFLWLGYGGYQEDRPGAWYDYGLGIPTRSVNHYHNPLIKPWDSAGLNGNIIGTSVTGQSQILWAQNQNQSLGGNWSWPDARRYFYIALTGRDSGGNIVASTQKEKERYFADTFRALGQLMHLVHDASVPEHVRNDIHILPAYEATVNKIRVLREDLWNPWILNPITFDKSILNITSDHPNAPVPISRIIDTDLYNEYNPGITKTLVNSAQIIGIAEYTNANFLSSDTMFKAEFPHPMREVVTLWTDEVNSRQYLRKTVNGDAVDHLAAVSLLYVYRWRYFPQPDRWLLVGLDPRCHEEYASKLIPRAVGYSAGLLNYFFRGKLQVTSIPIFYKNGIQYLRVKIKNMTPNETMKDGEFTLTYSYRPSWGKADGSDDIWGT
jgi:hypothetical protein